MAEWKTMDVVPPRDGLYLATFAHELVPELSVDFASFRGGSWRHYVYHKQVAWMEFEWPEPYPVNPADYVWPDGPNAG